MLLQLVEIVVVELGLWLRSAGNAPVANMLGMPLAPSLARIEVGTFRSAATAIGVRVRHHFPGLGGFGGGAIVPGGAMLGETSGGGLFAPILLMV